LKGILVSPYSAGVQAMEFKALLQVIEKDIIFLFGTQTPLTEKVTTLLAEFDESGTTLSKKRAFELARDFFPSKKNMSPKIYEHWGLGRTDEALATEISLEWQPTQVAEPDEPEKQMCQESEMDDLSASSRVSSLYSVFKRKRTSMDLY
jgi:hypothetical protein